MREKWEREDYARDTIEEALAGMTHAPRPPSVSSEPPVPTRGVVRSFSTVTALPVEWLWFGRVPLGMVTVIDGDPGLGKSLLTLDLAARVSRGWTLPDEGAGIEPAGVLILSAEDDPERTIKPRLDVAGADVAKVFALKIECEGEREPMIEAGDLQVIRGVIEQENIKLVIVDPLVAYLPSGIDSHRDQDVRRALAQLRTLAESTGAAIILVRHLNKSTRTGNPLYRGGGSIGIIGAARAGLLVARDPDNDGRRILAVSKMNLAPEVPSLAFHLEGDPHPRVEWEGTVERSARSLLVQGEGDERNEIAQAVDFLRRALTEERWASDLKKEARQLDISVRTLERAKALLGVRAVKVGRDWAYRPLTPPTHGDLAGSS